MVEKTLNTILICDNLMCYQLLQNRQITFDRIHEQCCFEQH